MMKDLFENNSSRYTAFRSRFGGSGSWMRRFFRIRVAAAAVVAMLAAGCEDELVNSVVPESDPRAIVFEFDAPDFAYATADGEMPATRTIPSMTTFPDGAIIHVIGTFTHENNTKTSAYGTYAFNKSAYRWVAQGQTLLWPEHATTADFEAFYLPDSLGTGKVAQIDIKEGGGSSSVYALAPPYISANDSIVHTDPLKATKEKVPYGAAVQMRFNHVCSRLILTDIGDVETNECWLEYTTGSGGETVDQLNNGYRFVITKNETGEYKGEIEFVPYDKMKSEKNIRYVRARMEKDELTLADKTTTPVNALCFYLAPGQYKGCRVLYRDEKPFLTLDVDKLESPGLVGGTSYTLDIRTAQGVVNNEWVDPATEWEGTDTPVIPQNLVEFMEKLAAGEEYECTVEGETRKLISRVEGGVQVNCDIDFDHKNMYVEFKNARKSFGRTGTDYQGCRVGTGVTIYGNHKRFINMASPLFDGIAGRVVDLQIKNADISIPGEDVLYDASDGTHSIRNVGALTSRLEGGVVENVLLDSVTVTATIPDMENAHKDAQPEGHSHGNAHPSVGALIGFVESGAARDIRVKGPIKVVVEQKKDVDKALAAGNHAHIGGLIGQQVGGSSSEFSAIGTGTTINVKVNLKSTANAYIYVGGVVGSTQSNVSDVSLMDCETTVDASGSECGEIYVGGIVGYANYENTVSRQMLQNAMVRGTVKGGKATTTYSEALKQYSVGHSATGGIAGCLTSFSMLNCRFNGDVHAGGRSIVDSKDVMLVSTGGGIGRIKESEAGKSNINGVSHVFECTVRATVHKPEGENVKNFTGAFIGQQHFASQEYRLTPYYANNADEKDCYPCPPMVAADAVTKYNDFPSDTNASSENMAANPAFGNRNMSSNGDLNFCGALYEDKNEYVTVQ